MTFLDLPEDGFLLLAQLTGIQIQPVEEIAVAEDEIIIKKENALRLTQGIFCYFTVTPPVKPSTVQLCSP